MPPRRITKFDKLVSVFRQLAGEFSRIDDAKTVALADSWEKFLLQIPAFLEEAKPPVTRSALTSGMEQGLREVPRILEGSPAGVRKAALAAFRKAVASHFPDFFERDRERLGRVIARGRIKNDSEWYLLRHRVDEIEGDPSQESELATLFELLGTYENAV